MEGSIETFALLDGGSTISVIDRNLAQRIGLHGEKVNMSVRGLWSGATHTKCERVICAVEGAHGARVIEQAYTVAELDLPSQSIPLDIIRRVRTVENIDLAAHQHSRPQILLGQDNWSLIESLEVRPLKGTGLVLSRSSLGWAVHGYLEEEDKGSCSMHVHAICCTHATPVNVEVETLAKLDTLMRNYFELENLGVCAARAKQSEEDRSTRILRETTRKIGEAWETGLLWKSNAWPKDNTRATALKRLHSLERRLDRNPTFAELYYREMDRLIENGYAVKVKPGNNSPRVRYISHFGVENENKPGKVRLVFDAAEKTNGVSMNDLLDTGPELLESLLGVLLRFRQYQYAVVADIKDMYLRVKVANEDRAAQRFLYRQSHRNREPDEYEMTCLIFGSKSSPCSALYVKNTNAERFSKEKPEAAKSIIKNSYMDDYLASGKSVDGMRKLVRDVSKINEEANFMMHGWASNDPSIVKDVKKEKQLSQTDQASLCDKENRVLGLFWDRDNDTLRFNVGAKKIRNDLMKGDARPIKREFCSIIMSVYDPLGILSPFTLGAKLIMQDVWRSGVGWDMKIRNEEFATWKVWLRNLKEMEKCHIPRCFIPIGVTYVNTQLHIFCDASMQAYAAAAYLRTESHDGKVYLSLVMAKTRVAPVKPTTVPRLELQAAVLGTRLAEIICRELDIEINEKTFWSDSTTVLQWIRVGPRQKMTFVKNRLGEIGETTRVSQWRWVPTQMNPADDATRFSKVPMRSHDRWLVGPEFLRDPKQKWPKQRTLETQEIRDIDELESRQEFMGTITANIIDVPVTVKLLGWLGLLAAAMRLRKCADHWNRLVMATQGKDLPPIPERSLRERKYEAACFWYRQIQETCFPQELYALTKGKPIHKRSRILDLRPYIDEIGVLRAEGRVKQIGDEKITFNSIILDAQHFATKLLIAAYHRRYFHANNETVVNELRQEYVILGLRSRLRSLAKSCIVCRSRRAQPNNPPMANLPRCRVAYNERPFSQCGIDYFGPMTVKIGRRHEKRWGVLFTCLTTRAIHLELANSLSASSAIMAIQRFSCRRGFPREMYSDNGTNFTKASKELKDAITNLDSDKIKKYVDLQGFKWHFNPPDAPHMGGAWERQIRSVKVALNHVLRDCVPFEEVLSTLLLEIEHMVNSRPLTHVSVDPHDEEALTPNHFLIGSSSKHLRLEKYEKEIVNPRKSFEIVQLLARTFWKRWLHEYLPTLLPSKKWQTPEPPLKVGDIVLIVDYQSPRNSWKKGKIITVHPNSADGIIRVAKVRAGKSELTRPVHKLIKIFGSE